jgi:hypothetical protein
MSGPAKVGQANPRKDQIVATEGRPDKDFLTRIANEVGERFPRGSRSREWLRKQVKIAIEQQNAHDQAVREQARKLAAHYHWLHRKPHWRDKVSGPPEGHPEWVWRPWDLPVEHFTSKMVGDCLTDEDDPCESIEGWGPPELLDESAIPPDPIHWLYPFGDPKRPPEQVIPAQCLILATVHDIALRGKGFELILQGMQLPPAFQVYLDFQTDDGSGMTWFDCGSIGLALKSVSEKLGPFERDAPECVPLSKAAKEVSDDSKLSSAELASVFGVPPEPLRKRLERLRQRDLTCFVEVTDRSSKEPQFLYTVGKVRHIIDDLQKRASGETSGKRPARKKSH